MIDSEQNDAVQQLIRAEAHFSQAPQSFFDAWRQGVELAGPGLFGKGTSDGLDLAACKWDLRPRMTEIRRCIGPMSSGQRVFLAALTSFYNAKEGGALCKRVGVHGLADLGVLDLQRRQVIADLILNYDGW